MSWSKPCERASASEQSITAGESDALPRAKTKTPHTSSTTSQALYNCTNMHFRAEERTYVAVGCGVWYSARQVSGRARSERQNVTGREGRVYQAKAAKH